MRYLSLAINALLVLCLLAQGCATSDKLNDQGTSSKTVLLQKELIEEMKSEKPRVRSDASTGLVLIGDDSEKWKNWYESEWKPKHPKVK
jgi:alpha-L-arabinofuranosidase